MEPTTTPEPLATPELVELEGEDEEFLFEAAKDPREDEQGLTAAVRRCYCYCHCTR
jgi:hypothetical protein